MRTNKLYDGPAIATEDIFSVYVVLNGPLGMTVGKAASQAFHCGWYVGEMYRSNYLGRWGRWEEQGRRVVVRLAETEAVFERVKHDCEGHLAVDEGMTEVEHGSETAFVTIPYRRADAPKVLAHKKLQLYRG